MFITFEGIDGCGKSTQARLLAEHLRAQDHEVVLTREPGGTPLAEQMRSLLLEAREGGEQVTPHAELLLFAAARSQHVANLIRPALERHSWVLCDRYTDSTFAYQCGGLRLDEKFVRAVNDFATQNLQPDLTFLFDLPIEEAQRRRQAERGFDRIESRGLEFQHDVQEAFLDLAVCEKRRIAMVDATPSVEDVHQHVLRLLQVLGRAREEPI